MKNNKLFKILMSGTLCIAAVVGSVFGLVACGNKNDDSLQKSAYKPIIDDIVGEADNENGVGNVDYDIGNTPNIKLMAVRKAAANGSLEESELEVTATITPENATNKAVDWSVAFQNASSAWASGKNVSDYVTVTPDSDGSLKATVKNLKAFGEKIVVTVTSRANVAVKATIVCDYNRKVTAISSANLVKSGTSVAFNNIVIGGLGNASDNAAYTIGHTSAFSDYTVAGTEKITSKIKFNDAFVDGVKTLLATEYKSVWEDCMRTASAVDKTAYDFSTMAGLMLTKDNSTAIKNKLTAGVLNACMVAVDSWIKANPTTAFATVTVKSDMLNASNVSYQDISKDFSLMFAANGHYIPVTGVTVTPGTIIW